MVECDSEIGINLIRFGCGWLDVNGGIYTLNLFLFFYLGYLKRIL
jgi:hypothetical protein